MLTAIPKINSTPSLTRRKFLASIGAAWGLAKLGPLSHLGCGSAPATASLPPQSQFQCPTEKGRISFEFEEGWTENEIRYFSQKIKRFYPIAEEIGGPSFYEGTVRIFKITEGLSHYRGNGEIALRSVGGLDSSLEHELTHAFEWHDFYPSNPAFTEGIATFLPYEAAIITSMRLNHPSEPVPPKNIDAVRGYLSDVFLRYPLANYYDLWQQPDLSGFLWLDNAQHDTIAGLRTWLLYFYAPNVFAKLYSWNPNFLRHIHAQLCKTQTNAQATPEEQLLFWADALQEVGGNIEDINPVDWLWSNPLFDPNPRPGIKIFTEFSSDFEAYHPNLIGPMTIAIKVWENTLRQDEPFRVHSGAAFIRIYGWDNTLLFETQVDVKKGKASLSLNTDVFRSDYNPERIRVEVSFLGEKRNYFLPAKVSTYRLSGSWQTAFGGAVVGIDQGEVALHIRDRFIAKTPLNRGAFDLHANLLDLAPDDLRPTLRYTVTAPDGSQSIHYRQALAPGYNPILFHE